MDLYTSDLDALHHIQRDVLRRLTYSKILQHSELLPDDMAGNAFNYHLKHLVSQKLIQKVDTGYTLSPLGRLVIDNMSIDAKRFKLRPTIGLFLLITSDDRVMQYASSRQPLPDVNGVLYGKLRIGDSIEQTRDRMLRVRGIDPDKLELKDAASLVNVRYYQDDELVCHRTGVVNMAEYSGDLQARQTDNGSSEWVPIKEASQEVKSLLGKVNIDIRIDV